MSSNGKIAFKGTNGANGNGNVWRKISAESFGLGVAEIVSMGVSLGVVGVADQVAPNMLKTCSKAIGKILQPHLESIENGLRAICKLEECQPDTSKPPEERAEALAKVMIVFSSAWATSMLFKLATRKHMNDLLGLTVKAPRTGKWYKDFYNDYLKPNSHDKNVFMWDEGVHYGSLVLLNTGLARYTDETMHAVSSLLEKIGFSHKKAHELATMGIVWELPNLLGFAAGVGAIAHHHKSNAKAATTHVEKLVQQTALTSTLHTPGHS